MATNKDYELILESDLFDYKYYTSKYNLNFKTKSQAITHYLNIGFKKGFNPSEIFNGDEYLNRYLDLKKAGVNPLLHYLKYGKKEGRIGLKQKKFKNFNDIYDIESILKQLSKEVLVIIELNNVKDSLNCVKNILNNNNENFDIKLLNIKNYSDENLKIFKELKNVNIINFSSNSRESIICDLNNIIADSSKDVIFIKDTIITFKKFIQKMIIAAYSNHKIGFVAPISNFSPIPLIEEKYEDYNLLDKISRKEYNESPMPNDSCIFIKKKVFSQFQLNENSENVLLDFYYTSKKYGWKLVFDDSTFVKNVQNETRQENKDNLDFLKPYLINNQVNSEFLNSEAFNHSYQNINNYLQKNIFNKPKNILYVFHHDGGVEYCVKDIVKSVSDEYTCYILKSYKTYSILCIFDGEYLIPIKKFKFKYPWHIKKTHNQEFIQIYFYVLINYSIDLVEIDHLLYHSFDLPKITKKLNIPTILALHDFYYICPKIFLLDSDNKYCGGYCENSGLCDSKGEGLDLPINIIEWKKEWQILLKKLFFECDVIITATDFTKNMFLEHYPFLNEKDIQIIEHGRDLIKYTNLNSFPNEYQPIKILFPGVMSLHKGREFIKELKKLDIDNKLELHFIGIASEELQKIGIYHGKYNREDFARYVSKIKPSFIGIFSIWAETYSYTLTESLSTGVPVFVSNLGALKSRIEETGGGWTIDINDPKKTYQKILNIYSNNEEYNKAKKELANMKIITTEEMGNNYKKLYKKLLK